MQYSEKQDEEEDKSQQSLSINNPAKLFSSSRQINEGKRL